MTRDQLLDLEDEALLQLCRTDCFRSTGPGGQHRNRNDTAVRLTLLENPGITAEADESRSQHENRKQALRRLRRAIALEVRSVEPPQWLGQWQLSRKNPIYPKLVGVILDALAQNQYRVSEAAQALGISTGQLNKVITRDGKLLGRVNRARAAEGLRPLRPRR